MDVVDESRVLSEGAGVLAVGVEEGGVFWLLSTGVTTGRLWRRSLALW